MFPRTTTSADELATVDAERAAVGALLREAREALGMQIAFLSRFVDDRRVIEIVDASCPVPFAAGDSDASEDTYCQRIVDGRLPQAIPDTALNPEAAAMSVTTELSVGSHVGVPIVLADGTVYGTLCAYSASPRPVDERDSAILLLVARSISQHLSPQRGGHGGDANAKERLAQVIDGDMLTCVYQPIIDLATGGVVAVEALARFPASFGRRTDEWFADAARIGEAVTLELAAIRRAVEALPHLPGNVGLSVNLSAAVLCDEQFSGWLKDAPVERLILELTEHEQVSDYAAIGHALAAARMRGLRLAVDDAGAGYASMRHTLLLKPNIVKLDMSLVRDVDTDRDKRALCRAIVTFANTVGSEVVAEGVETDGELTAVRSLGANYVQGFYLSRPAALPEIRLTGYRTGRVRRVPSSIRPETELMIHEMALAGASPATIAARLNQLGERTPRGVRWHAASVEAAHHLSSLRP